MGLHVFQELRAAEGTKAVRRVRLPPGTSDYQAAWILDDDDDDGVATDRSDDEAEDAAAAPQSRGGSHGGAEAMLASDDEWDPQDGTGTDAEDMMVGTCRTTVGLMIWYPRLGAIHKCGMNADLLLCCQFCRGW